MYCKNCNSNVVGLTREGELYCPQCGLVVEVETLSGEEIRDQQSYARDSSYIGFGRYPEFNSRLRRLDNESRYNKYTNFENKLDIVCKELGVPDNIKEDAFRIYKKSSIGKHSWCSLKTKAIACLYIAYERNNRRLVYRSVKDINLSHVHRLVKIIYKDIPLLYDPQKYYSPDRYLPELFRRFNISTRYVNEALQFIQKANEINSTSPPTVIAATAIYSIIKRHKLRITLEDLAEYVGRTTQAMRVLYKRIYHDDEL